MSMITDLDRRFVWHPYTQHKTENDAVPISHAKDASMYDEKGNEILDLICSWWTCLHGHSHPELNKALAEQAEKAPHVMFAAFTHEPAVKLASKLAELMPGDLNKVFYSDNGSTAVEVGLKMAYQYWVNKGDTQRTKFIAFDGAYHGDTFGAMAVGKGSGFFTLFNDLLCSVVTTPFVGTWPGDDEIEDREAWALGELETLLHNYDGQIAAIILEPLMQGSAGMNFCRPEFIAQVVELARRANILVIFDEVATGFGRTGTMFACEQSKVVPDIVCLSKGLTAGYMPMSVTVAREEIFDAFLGENFDKALAHGHSFTANPLACAVALRSLQLFEEENTLARIKEINTKHRTFVQRLQDSGLVEYPRALGSIVACNFAADGGYKSSRSIALRDWYLSKGFNIRPIGSTLYLMVPYCITDEQLDSAYDIVIEGLKAVP